MTMTLEQIQGMNLQVGDKFEIVKENNEKEMHYFQGIREDTKEPIILIEEGWGYLISKIEDIKVLEYKK